MGGTGTPARDKDEYHAHVFREHRWVDPKVWPLIARRLYFEIFYHALMDKGAMLSFFTLLTAMPTLLAFYSITTLVLDQNRAQVTELTDEFIAKNVPENFADNAKQIVTVVIGSTEQSIIMLTLSVLIALFSSSAYVRAFSRNANILYGRLEGRSLLRTWTTMWALTLTLILGLVFIAGAYFLREDIMAPFLNRFAEPLGLQGVTTFLLDHFLPVWRYLRWPVIFIVSMMLIAILYHVAPNVRYGRIRWITVGSVFALVGMTLVGLVMRFYLNNFGHIGLYGALGGVIAGLIGLVVANTILLLGIKLDAEVSRARELQAGMASEKLIQTPPRASDAVSNFNQLLDRLEEESVVLREPNDSDHTSHPNGR